MMKNEAYRMEKSEFSVVKEKCILGSIRYGWFSDELSFKLKPQDAPQDYLQSRYGLQAVCRGPS